MADDGMIINFEIPEEGFIPKQQFRGGHWKERLAAKRASKRRTLPKYSEAKGDKEELTLPGKTGPPEPPGPPPKRAKVSHDGDTSGFISSLFTYNETSSAPAGADHVNPDEETAEPSNAPLKGEIASFTELGLSSILASHLLKKMDIRAPTAIQRQAIQSLCASDADAFIQAETGSGKTLAYLLPMVQRIMELSKQIRDSNEDFTRESGLFAIILAPTRELSKQISIVLDSLLSCCHWIVSGTVIGGEKKKSEKARLRKGLNILVATPGRLADHLDNTEVLDVSRVRWLVLDEGDRLMELGFEKDIQRIVSTLNLRSRKKQQKVIPGLPDRRTTVLCSATLKTDVDQLRNIALKDPVTIAAEQDDSTAETTKPASQSFSAPAQLKQSYATVPPKQRLVTLIATLKQSFRRKGSVMRCIVFISCADSVDFHFEVLSRSSAAKSTDVGVDDTDGKDDKQPMNTNGIRKSDKIPQGNTISETRTQGTASACCSKANPGVQVFRLHGSLQQATRTSTLAAFTKCSEPAILVCTDVASRGLDLPHVDFVIEYDPPFSKDDHLHRVGRTARAGKDGRAMIFLMPGCEEGYVDTLKEGRPHNLTRHLAEDLLKKGFSPSSGVVSTREWETRATDWQLDVERWALGNRKHLDQARKAFQSHVRAYATHVSAERQMFDIKQLHLGHLAKAFALRDAPSNIRVQGLNQSKQGGERTKGARTSQAGTPAGVQPSKKGRGEDFDTAAADPDEARKKMRKAMKAMGGASEFNLV